MKSLLSDRSIDDGFFINLLDSTRNCLQKRNATWSVLTLILREIYLRGLKLKSTSHQKILENHRETNQINLFHYKMTFSS